jgi:hypothetical protein
MAKAPARAKGPSRPRFSYPIKEYTGPGPRPEKEPAPNFDLLSDDDKAKLREDALVKVQAAEKLRAKNAYLDAEIERIERELIPDAHEEVVDITIDLALGNDQIVLDGKWYMYGRKYKVKKSVYDSLAEIIARTHWHHAQIHNDPNDAAMRASQAIAKGGRSHAVINGSTGTVKF